jgi:hypothetical protein
MTCLLRIEVSACPSSNDHEARLLVDDADWLGREQLGMDPPELEAQLCRKDGGPIIVGRCSCGVVGCSDVLVEVSRTGSRVEWRLGRSHPLVFDAAAYDAELVRFAADRSWETLGRRVEREVAALFEGAVTEDGLGFDWASTRIRRGVVHLSFSAQSEQRLLDFSWDEATLESALDRAQLFHRERVRTGLKP